MNAKNKGQENTNDSRALRGKWGRMSWESHTTFTLSADKGDAPNCITETVITAGCFRVILTGKVQGQRRKMNIKR